MWAAAAASPSLYVLPLTSPVTNIETPVAPVVALTPEIVIVPLLVTVLFPVKPFVPLTVTLVTVPLFVVYPAFFKALTSLKSWDVALPALLIYSWISTSVSIAVPVIAALFKNALTIVYADAPDEILFW